MHIDHSQIETGSEIFGVSVSVRKVNQNSRGFENL